MPPANAVEELVRKAFLAAIREGRVEPRTIDDLEGAFATTQALRLRGSRILTLYASHIALALLIALGLRLFLKGQFWLHQGDSLSFALAALLLLTCLLVLESRWPKLWSIDPGLAADFVEAALDLSRKGPWQKDLTDIDETAWREGSDPRPAKRLVLKAWASEEGARVETIFVFMEEALGPFELVFSALLIAILDFFPLLERLSGSYTSI